MGAISTNADGSKIYVAMEDPATGFQRVAEADRTDLSAWLPVYSPGAGSATNIETVAANADKMVFHGNFGTNMVVILYDVVAGSSSNISPASLGAAIVNTLKVNPSDEDEMICTVNAAQDVYHTTDGGTTWTNLVDIGLDATALEVIWPGDYDAIRWLAAGDIAASEAIIYSPNNGDSTDDVADAGIAALTAICGIEVGN